MSFIIDVVQCPFTEYMPRHGGNPFHVVRKYTLEGAGGQEALGPSHQGSDNKHPGATECSTVFK